MLDAAAAAAAYAQLAAQYLDVLAWPFQGPCAELTCCLIIQVTGEYKKAKQIVTSLAASSRYGVWNNLGLEIDKV